MFSPATAAAILNRHNQNHRQEPRRSVASTRRTSPRSAHTHGSASSQGSFLSGGTTASRRGGGTNTNRAPATSRRLPFSSVGWGETPTGTYSVSSISHSTNSPRQHTALATDPPPAAKREKLMPNATEPKGSYPYDCNDSSDKNDNEANFITATDGPILTTTAQDSVNDMFIAEKQQNFREALT